MINRDDWLSPAAFVARIDLEAKPVDKVVVEVQRHSPEASRYKPLLLSAEIEAIVREATRRFAACVEIAQSDTVRIIHPDGTEEDVPMNICDRVPAGPRQSKET